MEKRQSEGGEEDTYLDQKSKRTTHIAISPGGPTTAQPTEGECFFSGSEEVNLGQMCGAHTIPQGGHASRTGGVASAAGGRTPTPYPPRIPEARRTPRG